MINRNIAPQIVDAVHFNLNLQPYHLFTLSNGVPVYSINAGAQEVLQIEWFFYAGNSYENKTGVAAATNFLLRNGTHTRTAFQLNEDFEYYGAFVQRSCYNETALVQLSTLSKHLDKLLPVVEDMLQNSIFPQSELDIYVQNSKQRLAVNLQKAEFVAGRLIDEYLYGKQHPYGNYTEATDLDAITREDVLAFYEQYYKHGSCAIFVSGKLPEGLEALLDKHFGHLPLVPADFTYKKATPAPAAEKKHRIENDKNAVQGAIRIASPFPNRHHPHFRKAMVLNNVFGGYFGSRLMTNIREEKGYTYGIYSYIQNHIQDMAWVISTDAGKDVCEATIAEVYKEMQRLREEPVGEDELMLVKNYMMGSILGELDGPFQIMGRWKNILLNQLPENNFNESIHDIKAVTPAELQELANIYLHPEKFYELVVY